MEFLNRIALIVTPKRRFMEWVNRLPEKIRPLTTAELPSHRMVYLAATGDEVPPLEELIDTYWEEIFEESLEGWTHDESLWPVNRTAHVFRDWFHVDCIDGIADADPHEPLTVRELARTRCAVCDAELPVDGTAIVTLADKRIRRLTFQEVESLEAAETPADDRDRPVMVFRCCSEDCAARAERAFTEALAAES